MLDVALVFAVGTAASYFPFRWTLERLFPDRTTPIAAEQADLLDWILERNDWVVLDLEATSLTNRAEPIEIAIVAADGSVLLDQLIMPKGNLKRSAKEVHGIDRKMLKGCPPWPGVMPTIAELIAGWRVITYNLAFDERVLAQGSAKWGIDQLQFSGHCAMLAYARHRAVPHSWRRGEWKWHKLIDAARHEGIAKAQDHRALGDAQMTRNLILKAAADRRSKRDFRSVSRSESEEKPYLGRGETIVTVLSLWFVFSLVYYLTGSATLSAIALAFAIGAYLASH